MGKVDIQSIAQIVCLEDELNRVYYAKNTGFSAVRLFFLKYITDNLTGAFTREEMQDYAAVQKMFAARNVEGGPNVLIPVLDIVDRHFRLNGVLRDSINEYAKELFGLDSSWNRKTASMEGFRRIMGALAAIDLTEERDSYQKGQSLVQELLTGIQGRSDGNRFMGEFASRKEIAILANGLLKVKTGETFLDFAAGTGTSTLYSVANENCQIINADVNRESLSIAAMLYIMNGYQHFTMQAADVLSDPDLQWNADKIFVDSPIGMKLTNLRYGEKIDASILSVYKTVESLNDNGAAVVTVPSGLLFGSAKYQSNLKKMLIENGYLQAVIALPLNWFGTGVTINLFVLSKKKCNKVLFINGHGTEFANYLDKSNSRIMTISQDGLNKILDIYHNLSALEGLSTIVSNETIVEKNYDLMPATYVKEQMQEESMTIEEIDEELAKLYAQIGVK